MEYGPRALGQRSILAPATSREIHTELNTRLKRSETMPFAPVMLIEDLDRWVTGTNGENALPWMTVNVKAKPELKRLCPAVVHVDGTLRPQVVSAKNNPKLHQLLHQYRLKTGIPALINTSFNMHEHPIVRTALMQSWPHSRPISTAFSSIQSTRKHSKNFLHKRVFFWAKLFTCQ